MKDVLVLLLSFMALLNFGCAAAAVGVGAAGGYRAGTDPRSVGSMVDDVTVSARVKSALIAEPGIGARNIDVDTVAGVVVLSGYVDSAHEQSRAAAVAAAVPGVMRVKNELKVGSRSAGQVLDDSLLGSRVKAKLIERPQIRALNIDVDVYSGVVYLTGAVASEVEREAILGTVRSVEGVRGLVDNLQLR